MAILVKTISGSGGLKPTIVVTAPTGSTVTCDGVQGTEVSGTWTFVTTIATHTIVATDGTNTKTETVVVDEVGIYEVSISYILYLYNEGDECTDVSGGWSFAYNPGGATLTKESGDMKDYSIGTSYGTTVCSGNTIDLSGYTYACIEWMSVRNTSYTNCGFYCGTAKDKNADLQKFKEYGAGATPTSKTIDRIAISDTAKTDAYIKWGTFAGTLYIYRIWLE